MTEGYKTKSFWAAVAGMVLAVLYALGFGPDALDSEVGKAVGLAGSLLVALGYTAWRGSVKAGQPGKAAWKQSEFWLSLAAVAVSLLMASGAFDVDGSVGKALAGAASFLALLGYGGAQAKSAPVETPIGGK